MVSGRSCSTEMLSVNESAFPVANEVAINKAFSNCSVFENASC